MKEEDIDKRIERVVESVGSKREAIRQWEAGRVSNELKRKVAAKRWRTYGISAAASIVVIGGIGIGFFIHRGGDTDYVVKSSAPIYRGGSREISEIQALIDSDEFNKALQAINATLADTIIESSFTEERQEYLRSLNVNRNYELTWLKIDILVKNNKTDDAITLLKEYVNADGEHQEEAKQLLWKLTR